MKLARVQNNGGRFLAGIARYAVGWNGQLARCGRLPARRAQLAGQSCPAEQAGSLFHPFHLRRPNQAAFTLAETLAALLFLAIVIPVAVEALHVASGAGEITVRKGEAARVADWVLSQSLVMTNWTSGSQNGTAGEGPDQFHWTLTSQNWPQDAMELLTANVTFSTQGRQYSVQMSTLANLQTQTAPAGATAP